MIRWIKVLIAGLLLASNAMGQVPAGARQLGIVLAEAQNASYDSARVRASAACSGVIHLFLPWPMLEPSPGQLGGPIYALLPALDIYYPAYQLQVELSLPVINTVRRVVPADLDTVAFDDPRFAARFYTLLDSVLGRMPHVQLTLLNIGNESDVALGLDPLQNARFRRFFIGARAHARQVYARLHPGEPPLRVGTTLTFDGLTGPLSAAWCRQLNDSADVIAVTYYGIGPNFRVKPPAQCRTDLLTLAAATAIPPKPIYLVECGYPSAALLGSSDSLQAAFVGEVFEAWDSLAARLHYVSFFQLTDWSQAQVDTLAVFYGLPNNTAFKEYLRTLGLRTWPGDGTDKLAFDRLRCEAGRRGFCSTPCRLPLAVTPTILASEPLAVVPNPAPGRAEVSGPAGELALYDALGRRVLQEVFSGRATLAELPPGLYWVRVRPVAGPPQGLRMVVE